VAQVAVVLVAVPVQVVYKGIFTMKNKIKSSKQRGQAIMEMCVCLIPILVVLLGMIFISGLGISNIRVLIEAKGNAEYDSRLPNAVGGVGNNIHHWDYGNEDPNNPDDGDGYPFTADDQTVDFYQAGADAGTEALMSLQLNNQEYSYSVSPNIKEEEEYIFMPTASLPYAGSNLSQNLPDSMLAAADLVSGTVVDSGFNKVFTLDSKHTDADEIKDLNLTFTHLFGIEIDSIDLRNMRANTVYYPALPTN
jgi:hypothetical protein